MTKVGTCLLRAGGLSEEDGQIGGWWMDGADEVTGLTTSVWRVGKLVSAELVLDMAVEFYGFNGHLVATEHLLTKNLKKRKYKFLQTITSVINNVGTYDLECEINVLKGLAVAIVCVT